MGMFSTRKPRGFRRVSIYTNERQEKLDRLVAEAKREEGQQVEERYDPDKFRGKFSEYTPLAKSHRDKTRKLSWPIALILIALLLFVWRYLLTGELRF